MKRRRNVTLIVCVVLAFIAAGAIFLPSVAQNIMVRAHFSFLFNAIKHRDTKAIDAFYRPHVVMYEQLNAMMEYDLLGWKITGVTGQPYPLDCMNNKHYLIAEMYYRLPESTTDEKDTVLRTYKVINHRQYGQCAVMPVKLEFEFDLDRYASKMGWNVTNPSPLSAENWPTPYIKGKKK